MADATECEAEPELWTGFRMPGFYLSNHLSSDGLFFVEFGFVLHILQVKTLNTDQNILHMTSLDSMGFLMSKDILTLETLIT